MGRGRKGGASPLLDYGGTYHMDRNEYIRQNVEQFHNNTVASRYQQSGLTDQSAKLNNAGFNKLMDSRGTVSYTHLDVYKRQTVLWYVPDWCRTH